MKVFTTICITFVIAALLVCNVQAQTPPWAKARVLGVSDNLVSKKIPGIDKPSNGLTNVGIGSKVYLYCGGKPSTGASGQPSATHFKSATFTLLSAPTGSNASISTIDSIHISFIPDVKGLYVVGMVGTDDLDQTDEDTVTISAGTYVGVGGIAGTPQLPNCVICHSAMVTKWQTTNHSTAFQRKIDETGGHFQSYCIKCHANGSTDPDSPSGGFIDLMKTSPWKFPLVNKPGNVDSLKLVDPNLANFMSIQCENCHGPGSEHQFKRNDPGMSIRVTSDQCNQCHDAPPYHTKKEEYENSAHSYSTDNTGRPEYMNRGSTSSIYSDCARCHTSNGYLDVFINGGPDPTQAFSKAPYYDVGYVGCVTCHNPHEKVNTHQLRKPIQVICADCHSIRPSGHGGLHHSHQGPMLAGIGGREIPGYVYYNSAHSEVEERCAQCHMAPPPSDSAHAYLKNKIGGHTFRVHYDPGTPNDESDDYINETGCISCHPISLELVHGVQDQIKLLLDTLKMLLPKRSDGNPLYPYGSDTTQLNDAQKIASWNYYFVMNDGSYGVHNKNYAWTLLQASIKALNSTAVEQLDARPGSFNLAQNYPNPFNPSTTIEFSVPTASNVRLALYDATGREVYVLANGFYESGTYRVVWKGNTRSDTFAPSGLYFYRFTAGERSATKKMLLLK